MLKLVTLIGPGVLTLAPAVLEHWLYHLTPQVINNPSIMGLWKLSGGVKIEGAVLRFPLSRAPNFYILWLVLRVLGLLLEVF